MAMTVAIDACSIAGCGNAHLARGYCSTHYRRWRLYGDPTKFSTNRTPEARFWRSFVVVPSGCWLWSRDINSVGYGRISVDGRKRLAHRWAYEFLVGPIPDGMVIDHLCATPRCVNPEHLEPVSQRVNVLRGSGPAAARAAATSCARGHELVGDNLLTRLDRPGTRECRTCRDLREKARVR